MFPPRNVRRPSASRIFATMAAVVDLPFEPVTPTTCAGHRSRNISSSLVMRARAPPPGRPAGLESRTAGLTTTNSAAAKAAGSWPPKCQASIGDVDQRPRPIRSMR